MRTDGMTSNERRVYQAMVERGFSPEVAREDALDGVDVKDVQEMRCTACGSKNANHLKFVNETGNCVV